MLDDNTISVTRTTVTTYSAVARIYGRRKIYVVGVAVFALASALCGLAASVTQLIWSRALQGIGAAMLVPGSLAIIGASFTERDRGRAIGTWSGFTAITTAAGPVLGGWLIEHASWRWAFFFNLPLSAVVILLTLWRVPESRNPQARGKPDWLGTIFASAALGGIVFALIAVAPLTTTVMNSVPEGRAGIGSGVNNAVSRLASVLAIALLGIVMVGTFDSHLDENLSRIPWPRCPSEPHGATHQAGGDRNPRRHRREDKPGNQRIHR